VLHQGMIDDVHAASLRQGASPPRNWAPGAGTGAPALLLQVPDLVHPAGVPAPGEFAGQKGVGDLQGEPRAGDARSQAQHVGVIVLPGHPGRIGLRAQRGPHAGHLVGRDGHADAGAADQDAPVAPPRGHGLGHQTGVVGVVARLTARGAHVHHGVAGRLKMDHQLLLQVKPSVVAADGDPHARRPLPGCFDAPRPSPAPQLEKGSDRSFSTTAASARRSSAAVVRYTSRPFPNGSLMSFSKSLWAYSSNVNVFSAARGCMLSTACLWARLMVRIRSAWATISGSNRRVTCPLKSSPCSRMTAIASAWACPLGSASMPAVSTTNSQARSPARCASKSRRMAPAMGLRHVFPVQTSKI